MSSRVLDYHRATALVPGRAAGPAAGWASPPELIEQQATDDAVSLPRTGQAPTRGTLAVVAGSIEAAMPPPRTGGVLGAILAYGHGLTGAQRVPGGAMPRRPSPSSGGLYPCTAVVATGGAGEIPPGVYAYAPVEHALVPVRPGPAAAAETRAAAGASEVEDPVVLVTAAYWRSAWKHGDRALRCCALDAGHVAGALHAAAVGLGARARLLAIEEPERLEALLGLDPAAAGVMAALGLELLGSPRPCAGGPVESLVRPAVRGEPVEGILREAALEATRGRGASSPPRPPPLPDGPSFELPEAATIDTMPLADAIVRRRSVRRFGRRAIEAEDLGVLLAAAALGGRGPQPCAVGVRAVEGLEPGTYRWDPAGRRLVLARAGNPARELAAAALGQPFVGLAAACLMPVADLGATVAEGGPRAYLDAHVDAGFGGQRLYLAASALGLGCCAAGDLADEEVDLLACLEGEAESVLLLYAVGLPREA